MRNLFVKGLPKALLEQHLKSLFSRCGNVSTVAVLRTKKGNSRGVAMVAMESNDQAQQAVSMLNGKWLHECIPSSEWCVEKECGAARPAEAVEGGGGESTEERAGVLHVEIAWKEMLTDDEMAKQVS